MTILTRPSEAKKTTDDKLVLPLYNNAAGQAVVDPATGALAADGEVYYRDGSPSPSAPRRPAAGLRPLLLFLAVALLAVSVGALAGTYIYRRHIREPLVARTRMVLPYDAYDAPPGSAGYYTSRLRGRPADDDLDSSNEQDEGRRTFVTRVMPVPDESLAQILRSLFTFGRPGSSGDGDDDVELPPFRDLDMERHAAGKLEDVGGEAGRFAQNVELDLAHDTYERVDVPDFRNGRRGRFVHDFNYNMSGIIDVTGKRCFVLPLDRARILPPRDMDDLTRKMLAGYYKLNTAVVRRRYRARLPAVGDVPALAGRYIADECTGMPVYQLVEQAEEEEQVTTTPAGSILIDEMKQFMDAIRQDEAELKAARDDEAGDEVEARGRAKRSVDDGEAAKFAVFGGRGGIQEFDIVNVRELERYEAGARLD